MDGLDILLASALGIGVLHTAMGVDHSLPFVVLGRARGWSLRRTLGITAACGLAHIASSVLLGVVGIGLGVAVEQLEWIEGVRGGLAAWGLIGFGIAYLAWGLWGAPRAHSHPHVHADGVAHEHHHDHATQHAHLHDQPASTASLTVWGLFVVFALGPCEALIPLLMAPAWLHEPMWVVAVIAVFGLATLGTMLLTVTVGTLGLRQLRATTLERWTHPLAGLSIAVSGLAIQLLGV